MRSWDWDELLRQALKAGLSVAEFWSLTPRDLLLTLEARVWRTERAQQQAVRQAWLTAALVRAKRMPALGRLLNARPARALHGAEAVQRRAEFKDLAGKVDLTAVMSKKNKSL